MNERVLTEYIRYIETVLYTLITQTNTHYIFCHKNVSSMANICEYVAKLYVNIPL